MMRWWGERNRRAWVLGWIAVLGGLASAATDPATSTGGIPFGWKISGAGLEEPSYLIGTIHLTAPPVEAVADEVVALFPQVDHLVTEIPMDMRSLQEASRHFIAPPEAPDLSELLGAELVGQVEARLAEELPGVSFSFFERLQPWAFYITWVGMQLQRVYPGQALDQQLYFRARVAGLQTDALETVEEQAASLAVLTLEDTRQLLRAELSAEDRDAASIEEQVRELLASYLSGDLDGFVDAYLAEMEDLDLPRELVDRFLESVLHERDQRMAERIAERLRQDPAASWMFAIGAMHLAGERSVLERLRAMGFTAERLPQGTRD